MTEIKFLDLTVGLQTDPLPKIRTRRNALCGRICEPTAGSSQSPALLLLHASRAEAEDGTSLIRP